MIFQDAAGKPVTVADLRGDGKGVALFFMRAANCAICLRHVRSLAGMNLADRGVAAAVVVPGGPADVGRVRRVAGALPVVSSDGTTAHRAAGLDRTLLVQHSGTLLINARDEIQYRLAATLPTGSFDRAALATAVNRL